MPFPFSGPESRHDLEVARVEETAPGYPTSASHPSSKTVESVRRRAGGEQNGHRKFRAEESSFFQGLSGGIR
jgi:hypothetical protein